MFKIAEPLILLSLTICCDKYVQPEIFILDGDYSEVARSYYDKPKDDITDLLYREILKQLEEEYNNGQIRP